MSEDFKKYKDPIFEEMCQKPLIENVRMHYGDLTTTVGAMIRRAFQAGEAYQKFKHENTRILRNNEERARCEFYERHSGEVVKAAQNDKSRILSDFNISLRFMRHDENCHPWTWSNSDCECGYNQALRELTK
ncbi:hypothetical protein BdPhPhi1402_gp04 [Bdellovibrio phage phi1402]|uniref:hypothetical protein n=1 Tax=Bdellovibrio phage phi1402 TaxID=1035662 RepID=UPI000211A2C2|nr:hypothetical protein BdPhPhi1402_gp04 [Bdellovibrio phage phi1402]AEG42301.1 hypothetical protein [Bdellovibrio phage phi1402]